MLVNTAFGLVGVGFIENKIARVFLPGESRRGLEKKLSEWAGGRFETHDDNLATSIIKYFNGKRVSFEKHLHYGISSDFLIAVFEELRKVGWGERVTYKELASKLGKPRAARAIGMAMAKNPIPLIVPCHRVVRSDGGLGGFTTPLGVELKRRMLELESPNGYRK